MTPLSFYRTYGADRCKEVAEAAKTNLDNFRQIMYGGSVSSKLAKRIADASNGEMSLEEILFPSDDEKQEPDAAA